MEDEIWFRLVANPVQWQSLSSLAGISNSTTKQIHSSQSGKVSVKTHKSTGLCSCKCQQNTEELLQFDADKEKCAAVVTGLMSYILHLIFVLQNIYCWVSRLYNKYISLKLCQLSFKPLHLGVIMTTNLICSVHVHVSNISLLVVSIEKYYWSFTYFIIISYIALLNIACIGKESVNLLRRIHLCYFVRCVHFLFTFVIFLAHDIVSFLI